MKNSTKMNHFKDILFTGVRMMLRAPIDFVKPLHRCLPGGRAIQSPHQQRVRNLSIPLYTVRRKQVRREYRGRLQVSSTKCDILCMHLHIKYLTISLKLSQSLPARAACISAYQWLAPPPRTHGDGGGARHIQASCCFLQ